MKLYSRAILSIALVALLAPLAQPAGAQSSNKPNIGAVEIVVKDIASKEDIAVVQPGGTVTLPEGARVRLIMTALPRGSARGPVYPATEYTDLTKGGVRITRSNEENAAADLEILNLRNPNRTQNIRFLITETWVPAELRTGTFSILVAPATAELGQLEQWPQPGTGNQAVDLTRILYRAILLREPDAGAQGTIDAIQRGGYEALVKAAVGIANSDESRVRIYEQPGLTNEKRLAALYENLLGLSVSQVDRQQWESDLRRINIGEIAAVVESLLRSDRFNSRYAVVR
jgi:hypothetical protein